MMNKVFIHDILRKTTNWLMTTAFICLLIYVGHFFGCQEIVEDPDTEQMIVNVAGIMLLVIIGVIATFSAIMESMRKVMTEDELELLKKPTPDDPSNTDT